ncbi:winged helix-turn-helix transcriptional regulator [Methanomassiliicoccaceae archaeon COG_1]|nr:winged helix-turn-helix transcriptional regulator [Methanomassiliicoccaceae archaeon COG_1]
MISRSTAAYRAIPDLEDRQRRVLAMVAKYPGMSRNDIHRVTRMTANNVSNRLRELELAGRIRVCGRKLDPITRRWVRQYEAVEAPA